MDAIDPNISNGTCWAAVNVALDDVYIPCGNVADGNSYACCHFGDKCVSSNACFHDKYGVTYLAGCTDKGFDGPACTNKGIYMNQSWVGLQRCDPVKTRWGGCPEKDEIVGISPPTGNCKCSDDTVLFEDDPTLKDIGRLPQTLGGTISWAAGHAPQPTSSKAPTTTSTSSVPMSTSSTESSTMSSIISEPSATNTNPAESASPEPGLSTNSKIGIGVGAGVGFLVLVCLVAVAVLLRKKKPEDSLHTLDISPPPQQAHRRDSPSIYGFKSELPAEPLSATSNGTGFTPSPMTSPLSPQPQQFKAYNPQVHGDYSRYSAIPESRSGNNVNPSNIAGCVSPQTTGQTIRGGGGDQGLVTSQSTGSDIGQALTTGIHTTGLHEVHELEA
ncbi:hypothetical protein GGR57DRAFT_515123 [Xylariaceae sp. FL1272]|nr:hypothetical protein GGR57DRAFT_515123 [Xylariaceae sp. FL1272]